MYFQTLSLGGWNTHPLPAHLHTSADRNILLLTVAPALFLRLLLLICTNSHKHVQPPVCFDTWDYKEAVQRELKAIMENSLKLHEAHRMRPLLKNT